MDLEIWRPIPGYKGVFDASDIGRVRRLGSIYVDASGRKQTIRGRIMTAPINTSGYRAVCLSSRGNQRTITVHSLVASAFLGPRPESLQVRHLDGDSLNNCLENLQYGTQSENMLDRVRHGRDPNAIKTECPRDHSLSGRNLRLRGRGGRREFRECRTCGNSQAFARWHHLSIDHQLVVAYMARRYEELQGEGKR